MVAFFIFLKNVLNIDLMIQVLKISEIVVSNFCTYNIARWLYVHLEWKFE